MEKTHGHRSHSPTRTENLLAMECGLVPQWDRLRYCYYYPIQHGTFHLGPVSQRVS